MTALATERVRWRGRVAYDDAVALQERLVEERLAGPIPDTLLLLEHPPTITLGRGTAAGHVLADPDALAARGVHVVECARGGDVTYHGPGQLVGYAIVDLRERGRDVHRFLRDLEALLIDVLSSYGLDARREEGLTGVWVGEAKVAAIGVAVRRWVTWHGFALNVADDLRGFADIVPCGIADRGVTSLARLLGREMPLDEVAGRVGAAFLARFGECG